MKHLPSHAMRTRLFQAKRGEVTASVAIMIGAALGAGLFLGLSLCIFAAIGANPRIVAVPLLFAVPALIAGPMLLNWHRNSLLQVKAPRSAAASYLVGYSAGLSFAGPVMVIALPLMVLCLIGTGKARQVGVAMNALGISNFYKPAA